MARQLLILRHAKSAWDTNASSDFDRPLAKRGEKDAPAMGAWMREQQLFPDHIVSSPAKRAKQTVIKVCHALDMDKKDIHWDARVYGADTSELMEVLSEVPSKAKSVLLVGHNPGLESLVSYLAGDLSNGNSENDTIKTYGFCAVKTATLVHLEIAEKWNALKPKCATFIEVKYPRELSPLPQSM